MLNIFDQYGRVRADLESEAATIEVMPDDQRAALVACLAAARAADDGEDRLIAARKNRDIKNRAHDEALARDHAANPAILPHEALRAVSAANGSNVKKAKTRKLNKEARAALTTAINELADARAEYHQAEVALRTLSATRGDAVLAYMRSGKRVTDEDVAREYQARGTAERQAIADGTAPKEVVPVRLSKLDETMAARGALKTANRLPVYHGAR
jgi:hypothetical protein